MIFESKYQRLLGVYKKLPAERLYIAVLEYFLDEEAEKVVRTVHDIYDETGNIVGEKLFDLCQESTGTLRFLAYIQNIIEMISDGGGVNGRAVLWYD